ncbi:hypothetical protein MXMO3_01514 [Maritalea myrionectae]|uniref:Uncharacterized protein n=1 Tax=Maritalea myrionectae TaxID=454601 RepID=A0A2R4MDP2_9HYPH|nr:hypothetical protein [Maritalea myrionectae]AVX04044.1 hypothetical protein MXMO3_01514 [Maritalea myrionectae]
MPDLAKEDLKQLVRSIVISQGNRFIKELLREHEIKIGTKKDDFLENLFSAIDREHLTQDMLEAWLSEVEGWGNQHIYFLERPDIDPDNVLELIENSEYSGLINKSDLVDFPDELELTSIQYDADSVTFSWHKGINYRSRAQSKDYSEEIDGDTYEFQAYLVRSKRTVLRFEWNFRKPYSTLFIQLPNSDSNHENAISIVMETLRELNFVENELAKIPLSTSVHGFRERPNEITSKANRLHAEGGYADLVTQLPEGGIESVEAIRNLARAVGREDFPNADGKFRLSNKVHEDLSCPLTLEIIGRESRVRIWVQCKRRDVYLLNDLIWEHC